MKIYDYSNLLTVIDKLNIEKAKLINARETEKKNQLLDLENELSNSGMLEDWHGLIQAMKKAGVRGCPWPHNIPGISKFEDNYRFVYPVYEGSSGYRCDYYALYSPKLGGDTVSYCQWSTGYGSEQNIDIFARFSKEPIMHKVRVKTKLIEEFMKNYPKYREIKLKEVYEAIGAKTEEVEKLR